MKPLDSAPRLLMAGALSFCQAAFAHAPVIDCYLERDDLVKCEAGYTDGSSAAGRKINVQDPGGKVLLEASLDQDNSYTFAPPSANYSVVFLGGDGHDATIQSADISR